MIGILREVLTLAFIGFALIPYTELGLVVYGVMFIICFGLMWNFWSEIDKMGKLADASGARK